MPAVMPVASGGSSLLSSLLSSEMMHVFSSVVDHVGTLDVTVDPRLCSQVAWWCSALRVLPDGQCTFSS